MVWALTCTPAGSSQKDVYKRHTWKSTKEASLGAAEQGMTLMRRPPRHNAPPLFRRAVTNSIRTVYVREARYALGYNDILYSIQSRTELQDTVAAIRSLAHQYPTLAHMHCVVLVRGQVTRVPCFPDCEGAFSVSPRTTLASRPFIGRLAGIQGTYVTGDPVLLATRRLGT